MAVSFLNVLYARHYICQTCLNRNGVQEPGHIRSHGLKNDAYGCPYDLPFPSSASENSNLWREADDIHLHVLHFPSERQNPRRCGSPCGFLPRFIAFPRTHMWTSTRASHFLMTSTTLILCGTVSQDLEQTRELIRLVIDTRDLEIHSTYFSLGKRLCTRTVIDCIPQSITATGDSIEYRMTCAIPPCACTSQAQQLISPRSTEYFPRNLLRN